MNYNISLIYMSITFPIQINSSNYIGLNKYTYKLPNGSSIPFRNGAEIAIESCSIYNSVFNIRADWGNNTMVIFYDNFNLNNITGFTTGTSYTDNNANITVNKKYVKIVIDDGFYDISALDLYIKNKCLLMGFYLTNPSSGNDMFFINFQVNSTRYKTQVNMYPIPNTASLNGYVNPSNTFTLPSASQTPYLYFTGCPSFYSNQYGSIATIFGMNDSSFFPYSPLTISTGSTIPTSTLSTKQPVVSPINTYFFTSNISSNPYSLPSNFLFSMPINASFGEMMVKNNTPSFISCQHTPCQEINIQIYDQYKNPLIINDYEFNITILIRIPPEIKN